MQSRFKERLSYQTNPQELEQFIKQTKLDHSTRAQEPERPEKQIRQERTALHDAAEFGYPNFALTFIEHGDDINVVDAKGRTPLHVAVQAGQEEMVRLLIHRGADVNIKDNDGLTPLHFAAMLRSVTLVRLLVQAGANPRAENVHGHTPFLFAFLFEENEILKCFAETSRSKVEAGSSSTLRGYLVNVRPWASMRSV
ncbi:ankyrin repeat protein [Aspergillus udagawae]|nr:ankyrin repeat protein [Aspergillus udagawae]